jgi:hypothetical protein
VKVALLIRTASWRRHCTSVPALTPPAGHPPIPTRARRASRAPPSPQRPARPGARGRSATPATRACCSTRSRASRPRGTRAIRARPRMSGMRAAGALVQRREWIAWLRRRLHRGGQRASVDSDAGEARTDAGRELVVRGARAGDDRRSDGCPEKRAVAEGDERELDRSPHAGLAVRGPEEEKEEERAENARCQHAREDRVRGHADNLRMHTRQSQPRCGCNRAAGSHVVLVE